jgi:hypothetical protein
VLLAGTCTGFGRTVCGSPIGWVKAQGEGKVVAVMFGMRPGVAGFGFGRRRCVARCV